MANKKKRMLFGSEGPVGRNSPSEEDEEIDSAIKGSAERD
jgi:hypothetical protein